MDQNYRREMIRLIEARDAINIAIADFERLESMKGRKTRSVKFNRTKAEDTTCGDVERRRTTASLGAITLRKLIQAIAKCDDPAISGDCSSFTRWLTRQSFRTASGRTLSRPDRFGPAQSYGQGSEGRRQVRIGQLMNRAGPLPLRPMSPGSGGTRRCGASRQPGCGSPRFRRGLGIRIRGCQK